MKLFIISILLLLIGCAVIPQPASRDFFDINMKDMSKAEEFYMKLNEETLDDTTDWHYWYDDKSMNTNLYGFATFWKYGEDNNVQIKVFNKTTSPIKTNYFLDEFALIDIFGNSYMIERPEITNYPSASYINPNSELIFDLEKLPVEKENILSIIVGIAGKKENYIVLKRIPKIKLIQH